MNIGTAVGAKMADTSVSLLCFQVMIRGVLPFNAEATVAMDDVIMRVIPCEFK